MVGIRLNNGSIIKVGDKVAIETKSDDNEFFNAEWEIKEIRPKEMVMIVDHTNAQGYSTENLEIPLNMWEGVSIVELTSDDMAKDPNLAFRFRSKKS